MSKKAVRRAKFLEDHGGTVLPELFPHLWMDVPKPVGNTIKQNMLYMRWHEENPYREVMPFFELRVDQSIDAIEVRGVGVTRFVPGTRKFSATIRGSLIPTTHLLDEVFNSGESVWFSFRDDQAQYEFQGLITDVHQQMSAQPATLELDIVGTSSVIVTNLSEEE